MTDQTETGDYSFSWNDLGDIPLGRPNLGSSTSIVNYRLLQYTFKDVLTEMFGKEKTHEVFRKAGYLAGTHFCRNILDTRLDFHAFIADFTQKLVDYKIGILRFEMADLETLRFTITCSEDLDCSGLPVYGETVCDYDEGFFAGILECYCGKPFSVLEIDCWSTGDRTCRFKAEPKELTVP